MYQLEAERWAKNALGLAAVLLAIFAGYGQVKGILKGLSPCWPFLASSAVSAVAVLIASSIRGTTDAWKATVRAIEKSPEDAQLEPFLIFAERIHRARNRPPQDLAFIFFGIIRLSWRRRRVWIRRTLFSVTRLYTLLFAGSALLFLIIGVSYAGVWHLVSTALIAIVSFLRIGLARPGQPRDISHGFPVESRSLAWILKLASAICGAAAALFWFLAAHRTPIPPTGSYWDVSDSPNTQFAISWRRAARLNQFAAILTALSIFLAALSQL